MGNLGAQKEKRNDTPISAKKDIMGDKTVRVRADLHHIIKIETAKNGGNVKEVMEIRLRSKLKSVLIVHYLKILYYRSKISRNYWLFEPKCRNNAEITYTQRLQIASYFP